MREKITLLAALGAALLVATAPASAQGPADRLGQGGSEAAASTGWPAAPREPAMLLREAERAVQRGEMTRATELVERAETAILNMPGDAAGARGDAASREALVAIGQARRAVFGGDRAQAQDRVRSALYALEGGRMAAGSGAGEAGRMGYSDGGAASGRPN